MKSENANPTEVRVYNDAASTMLFDLANPDWGKITPAGFARALGGICRYNCQTPTPTDYVDMFETIHYSVAQHEILCALMAMRLGWADHIVQGSFFHDHAEFATGDVITPVKNWIPGFKELEKELEMSYVKATGNRSINDPSVKDIDYWMYLAERRYIFNMELTGEEFHAVPWHAIDPIIPWSQPLASRIHFNVSKVIESLDDDDLTNNAYAKVYRAVMDANSQAIWAQRRLED